MVVEQNVCQFECHTRCLGETRLIGCCTDPCLPGCCGWLAGWLLRGTGREVAADERSAAAHALMAAPVDDTLQLAYPDVYMLTDTSGHWGTEQQGQVMRMMNSAARQLPALLPHPF
jgi:hypothetical protein